MLSEKAQKIFEMKYAIDYGARKESWEEACFRVAHYVASAEKEFGADDETILNITKEFYRLIANCLFIPGGRILANAGTTIRNLFNCFVIPVGDSRQEIYGALNKSAEIFAHGGGVGYNFSHIREKGAPIKSTGGNASGPLSFMELFNLTGEVIQQASRRGAQMGILNIDHPDIIDFILYKSNLSDHNKLLSSDFSQRISAQLANYDAGIAVQVLNKTLLDNQLTHFNISVGLSDAFMQAVENDDNWNLISRIDGHVTNTIPARELMKMIATSAWICGDPGVMFLDTMEKHNMTPYLGKLEATNPCSEVTLLPYEACCLGSINISALTDNKTIDWYMLDKIVYLAIRFLDDVHSINYTPIEEINDATRNTRRLGLGIMGWADTLVKLGMPYDSDDARNLARYLMYRISKVAWNTSKLLAEERGAFPAFDKDKCVNVIPYIFKDELPSLRNVAVTSIAPTGTIAILAGVNSGIEPFFALSYKRYITEGIGNHIKDVIVEVNPLVRDYFENISENKEKYSKRDIETILDSVSSSGLLPDWVDETDRAVFKTANEIHWKDHISMQAAFQEYVDNAISKTINMPETATIEDVMNAYITAWKSGLKSIALYRDNSKGFQILNK